MQWDKISAVSRSFARTLWIHVPTERKLEDLEGLGHGKKDAIKCVHILAVALKHHLRGERDWDECGNLKQLLATLPNV